MVSTPPAAPVTMPVVEPTVATPMLVLLHVPPVVASANVVEPPTHIVAVPDMAAGAPFTVTIAVELPQAAV